jgi:alkanesulfonate monooxygenase SsuD/methylene tetrahydromethanopterin reductase-like flavin-dependent oxidoreductase (luciferase family)
LLVVPGRTRDDTPVRLGTIHLQTLPWLDLEQEFRDAEASGVDAAYVADHLTHPTLSDVFIADGWAVLAAAAQVTRRIDLGTLVGSTGFRSPLPLARAAATVQEVSGGRFVLGLGAGTAGDVAAATGELVTTGDLARRFADSIATLDRIFRGEQPGVDSLPVAPGRARPFLLLAAHGPRAYDLVGRYADGWSTYGGSASVTLEPAAYWDVLAEQRRAVDEAYRRHDRDPSRLRRSLLLGYGTIRPVESVATFTECLERAATLGFDEVVVYWPREGKDTRFRADPAVFADCLAVPRG